MKRRLAAAVIAVSALGVLATAAPASAAQLCINADVNVNGTAQTLSQCLPQ